MNRAGKKLTKFRIVDLVLHQHLTEPLGDAAMI